MDLNESTCKFQVSSEYFRFYFIVHRSSCKQTVMTLVRRRILRRLNMVSAVCTCFQNEYLNGCPQVLRIWSLYFEYCTPLA